MDNKKVRRIVRTVEEVKRKAQLAASPATRLREPDRIEDLSERLSSWWVILGISLIAGLLIYMIGLFTTV